MDAWEQLALMDKALPVEPARWVEEFHAVLRATLEEALGHRWHVTKIKLEADTTYQASRLSRLRETPDYQLAEVVVAVTFEATKTGPLDMVLPDKPVPLPIAKERFVGYAVLGADGRLHIQHCGMGTPRHA